MKHRPGFTLIELLIVAAVFSLTALVATTVITRVQSTQRQILGKQRVVADGRYVLETMARAIRQGSIDYASYASLSGAQTMLAVLNQNSGTNGTQYVCYRLSSNKIQTATSSTGCAAATTWTDITPADLSITNFSVWISPQSDPFKSAPRQTSDCAVPTQTVSPVSGITFVTQGYNSSNGTCVCSTGAQCFPDQVCSSTTTFPVSRVGQPCDVLDPSYSCICKNANQQPEVTIMIGTDSTNQASGEAAHSNLQTTVTSHVYRR